MENNRLDFLQKRLEQQSNEIILLKKELVNLQMANLTDSKLNVYSIHYPIDLAHKSIILPESISIKRANSFQQIASASVHDLKLLKTKTSELSFPENISIKKHNYMSVCALNESLLIIGDDLGRLLLWDLIEDRELAFVHIKSGLEIKALALFSYDSAQFSLCSNFPL